MFKNENKKTLEISKELISSASNEIEILKLMGYEFITKDNKINIYKETIKECLYVGDIAFDKDNEVFININDNTKNIKTEHKIGEIFTFNKTITCLNKVRELNVSISDINSKYIHINVIDEKNNYNIKVMISNNKIKYRSRINEETILFNIYFSDNSLEQISLDINDIRKDYKVTDKDCLIDETNETGSTLGIKEMIESNKDIFLSIQKEVRNIDAILSSGNSFVKALLRKFNVADNKDLFELLIGIEKQKNKSY